MSEVAIGIDLGTTNSVAAYINASGKPEIIPNAEGNRLTPSAIYFPEGAAPEVGDIALSSVGAYSDRTVRWVKRQMGNPEWRFTLPEGKSYSAVELSALILARIRVDSEQALGVPIREAVITVPAYFDEVRRAATMKAAELAGLRVKRLINEPSAAAVAFANLKGESADSHYYNGKPMRILVYDFGGGTFDVSIVDVYGKDRLIVRASDGVHWLGGYDLDVELARYYNRRLEEVKKTCIQQGTPDWLDVVSGAERDKKVLSKLTFVKGKAESGRGDNLVAVHIDITQQEFWELIHPYVTQTKMEIDVVLQEAKISSTEIEDVVLIGGSTRCPLVIDMLTRYFNRVPISPLNVDEAVAIGAALEASKSTPTVTDVASHGYGTIVSDYSNGQRRKVNVTMIEKNASIPAEGKRTFYTTRPNQKHITCHVTQGEGSDPGGVLKITSEYMELSPGLPKGSPVNVSFSYDANMRMKCSFTECASGNTKHIEVDPLVVSKTTQQRVETHLPDELDLGDFERFRLG